MMSVSVLIPCFDCERFIANTIESVLRQKNIDLELIVLNDGSADNSLQIIKNYSDSIKIIDFKTNRGVYFARNYLLNQATKEFVWFLDADDEIVGSNHTIHDRISFLKNTHSRVAGCYGNYIKRVWRDNQIIVDGYIDIEMGGWLEAMALNRRIPTTSNLLWKKEAIQDIKWHEDIKAMMDGFFCLEVYKAGKSIVHCGSKEYSILGNVNWSNKQITNDKTRLRFYAEKLKQDFIDWFLQEQNPKKGVERRRYTGEIVKIKTGEPVDSGSRTNLFIIGAPRCGTTSLWSYLKTKQKVVGSRRKEMLFFDTPLGEHDFWGSMDCRFFQENEPSWTLYRNLFEFQKKIDWEWRLDATSSYLYSSLAIKRIKEYNPDARFIVALRDPVDRALSAWRNRRQFMCLGVANEMVGFADSLRLEPQRCRDNWHWLWRYKQAGCYARYLKDWLEEFDLSQFFFVKTSEISLAKTSKELCAWLNIEHHGETIKKQNHTHHRDPLNDEDLAAIGELEEYYRSSLRELHDLIGIDL